MAQSSERDDTEERQESPDRPTSVGALWSDVRIDPVEIALPAGVGFTLRAYRSAPDLVTGDTGPAEEIQVDDFEAAAAAVAASRASSRDEDAYEPRRRGAGGFDDADDFGPDDGHDEDTQAENAAEEEPDRADTDTEDVPVFLARRGRLFLFRRPDRLVDFVRSGAEHDLGQLDTWSDLVARVKPTDIVALAEDHYELDLLVPNLRGGPDAWDPSLILKAGELARDLGYALRMEPVLTALAPGSPLDDLDEALRAAGAGGIGGFLARRRLRRIPAQQSALAWRTIVGKISAVVDWRD